MAFDLPPKLWLPAKPAIIRAASLQKYEGVAFFVPPIFIKTNALPTGSTLYNTVGTQTVSIPAGYTSIVIDCYGPGGGGNDIGKTAGGGGAFARKTLSSPGAITLWLSIPTRGQSYSDPTGPTTVRLNNSLGTIQAEADYGRTGTSGGYGAAGDAGFSTGDEKRSGGTGGTGGGGSAGRPGADGATGGSGDGVYAGAGGGNDVNGGNYGGGGGRSFGVVTAGGQGCVVITRS